MHPLLRFRLSMMMFLHYFIMGSWFVVLVTFLLSPPGEGGLGFSSGQNAWIHSTMAIAGLIAPPMLGLLADQLFATQRLLGVLYLFGSGLMGAAWWWCAERQPMLAASPDDPALVDETFLVLFALLQCYALVNLSTGPLTSVLALRNMHEPQRRFAGVRLFGTLGWIAACFLVAWWLDERSAEPMALAAVASLVMGAYCFTLPHTPPKGSAGSVAQALGLPALRMFRDRNFAVFMACAFALAGVQSFYTLYANKYLHDIDLIKPTAVQTLAQWGEVGCMLLLPLAVRLLGVKRVMLLGLAGWVLRNGAFALGTPGWAVAGLCLHGLCFTFFFILSIQYVDLRAPADLRASAQGVYAFTVWGAGTLSGNWVGAAVGGSFLDGGSIDWPALWLVPTVGSFVIMLAFAALFRFREPAGAFPHHYNESKNPNPNPRPLR